MKMLRKLWGGAVVLLLCAWLLCPPVAGAYAQPVISQVRFGASNNRIVFDLDRFPGYQVKKSGDGSRIVMDIRGVAYQAGDVPVMKSELIRQATVTPHGDGVQVSLEIVPGAAYRVVKLRNPARLFIEAYRTKKTEAAVQPVAKPSGGVAVEGQPLREDRQVSYPQLGLELTHLVRTGGVGNLSAYVLKADRAQYTVQPALDQNRIVGLEPVSQIAAENQAVAAVNSSYFASSGWLIGLTKLDGQVVAASYPERTAVGMLPNGSLVFGNGSYQGNVTINGVAQPVSGVNCDRTENSLVIYNPYYDSSTRTNEFGLDYVVRGGKVVDIVQQNASIPRDGFVVSVHGAAKEAFQSIMVGDRVELEEHLGNPWNKAVWMQGVGPRLVSGGQVHVTEKEERFPSDIAKGRAPRTAFGVDKDGNYIFMVVDGRQKHSIGCTLSELATLMKRFGAVDAINFDGGGSSEMVVEGKVLNSPSDGNERRVGCAMLLMRK